MTIEQPQPTADFTAIPILPLSHARDPFTKPKFLTDLRDALLNVGFLYLSETGLPEGLVGSVVEECHKFFDEGVLPLEEKEAIEMKNAKSFLGWSRVCESFSEYGLVMFLNLGLPELWFQCSSMCRWTSCISSATVQE